MAIKARRHPAPAHHKEPLPAYFSDLGRVFHRIPYHEVLRIRFLHQEDDNAQVFVWVRIERIAGRDVCGPMSPTAAAQVAAIHEGRVQWLSRLKAEPPVPLH